MAILFAFFLICIFGELFCRLLPVYEGNHRLPVNQENPILHLSPSRTFTWSKGWKFSLVNEVRVNNEGFVNNEDYHVVENMPLLTIVGDSYVEAMMVPFEDTFMARLAKTWQHKLNVYTAGISGAPVSQYLKFVEYFRKKFKSRYFIINIVGNDFDESMLTTASMPGHHYYDESFNLVRLDFNLSPLKKILRHSALFRYVVLNLQVSELPRYLFKQTQYVGNVLSNVSAERLDRSRQVIMNFLDDIPRYSGVSPDNVLLVMDGCRPHLYDPNALEDVNESFFTIMRNFFLEQAEMRGYPVLDLQPIFIENYEKFKKPFEYKTDAHWNSHAHEVVAQAITESEWAGKLLKECVNKGRQGAAGGQEYDGP